MYCTKCKIKFPDQITKHSCKSITEQPENYEGFVYKIVVLKTSVKTEATIHHEPSSIKILEQLGSSE